jgi:predicted  nucleic acid-binding Zn-ribbon protein
MSDDLEKVVQNLKTLRDEIKVQLHLAKAELKDEWEELEPRFEEMEEKLGEAAEGTRQTVNVIAEELTAAYRRIKDRL